MEICEKWRVTLVNKEQRSPQAWAQTRHKMCSLRRPIRVWRATQAISHQPSDRLDRPASHSLIALHCEGRKLAMVYKSLLSHLEHNVVLSALILLCLLAVQPSNCCLDIPFNNKWSCILPTVCLKPSSTSWSGTSHPCYDWLKHTHSQWQHRTADSAYGLNFFDIMKWVKLDFISFKSFEREILTRRHLVICFWSNMQWKEWSSLNRREHMSLFSSLSYIVTL